MELLIISLHISSKTKKLQQKISNKVQKVWTTVSKLVHNNHPLIYKYEFYLLNNYKFYLNFEILF